MADTASKSPFWRMLESRAAQVRERLLSLDSEKAAEFSALVGFSGHAANGDSDKVQSLSEVVYALVVIMADKMVDDFEKDARRDKDAGNAMATHVATCPQGIRIEGIERAVRDLAKKPRQTPLAEARDLIGELEDTSIVKPFARTLLFVVSLVHSIRYVVIAAVVSPHAAPLFKTVTEALGYGK